MLAKRPDMVEIDAATGAPVMVSRAAAAAPVLQEMERPAKAVEVIDFHTFSVTPAAAAAPPPGPGVNPPTVPPPAPAAASPSISYDEMTRGELILHAMNKAVKVDRRATREALAEFMKASGVPPPLRPVEEA